MLPPTPEFWCWHGSVWPYRGLWQQFILNIILILKIIDLLEWILTVKVHDWKGILTEICLSELPGKHMIHIDRCLKVTLLTLTVVGYVGVQVYLRDNIILGIPLDSGFKNTKSLATGTSQSLVFHSVSHSCYRSNSCFIISLR